MFNNISKNVFIIGIGGISLSALAQLLKQNGHEVSGSDECVSTITKKLETVGIKVFPSHNKDNLGMAQTVIYSAAINDQNEELSFAKRNKLQVLSRAELLGIISNAYQEIVAVSGSHGKTTTTALIAHIFQTAGLKPTAHIGGECNNINGNLLVGENNVFLTEACEYCDSFLCLQPTFSIILNIQADHLDYFKTLDNLVKSFIKFGGLTTKNLFVNIDDEICRKEFQGLPSVVSFSIDKKMHAEYCADNLIMDESGRYSFDVLHQNNYLGRIYLPIVGGYNIYNALATIAVSLHLGIDFEIIISALATFSGIKRRYEYIADINGARVIHDYAHHPTEIIKVLEETRLHTKGKLIVVFQPHTFSRTKNFFVDFVEALCIADFIVLFPIYPAREKPIDGVTSYALSHCIKRNEKESVYVDNYETLKEVLINTAKENDTIMILGAGDIYNFCDYLTSHQ